MNKRTEKKVVGLLVTSVLLAVIGCKSWNSSERTGGEAPDDRAIVRKVKNELNNNALTQHSDIKVNSSSSRVTLTGVVDNPSQKQAAEDIVLTTPGVSWYQDNISVRSQAGGNQVTGVNEAAGAQTGRNNPSQGGQKYSTSPAQPPAPATNPK